jgi:putative mRNA 3-end processing factor
MGSRKIALDPTRRFRADYVFISHAHSDHLPPSFGDATVIASEETIRLAQQRGLKVQRHVDSLPGLELVETGHILGSRGLFVDGLFYYTGDLGGRARAFMPSPKRVKCETLVIESTYGRPNYVFPPLASVLLHANRLISGALDRGRSAVIEGYPLGKSQVLTYLFQSWSPLYVYGSVKTYNDIYRELGVELPECAEFISSPAELNKLKRRPGVAVFPTTGLRGEARRYVESIKAAVIRFTGWALSYSASTPGSQLLPISDHADFQELTRFVRSCRPDTVLTCHGFASEFSMQLRSEGYSSRPVSERQVSITDYIE